MKKNLLIFLVLFLAGCKFFRGPKSPYKDFSTHDGITHFKFCDMSTTRRQFANGDITEVILDYTKMNDSVFWSSRRSGFPYSIFLRHKGCTYERELQHSGVGDSLIFIVPADSVFQHILNLPLPFFLHVGDMMKAKARVIGVFDSAGYKKRVKGMAIYRKDMDMQEQITLLRYVSDHNISDTLKHDNMYIIPITEGTGPQIKRGDMVNLAYKGSFLDGTPFDSVPVNAPLQFRYGDTAQAIEGLTIAIKRMREGGKAKIIIPSQLAFGNNGSSTGIVPPYTTVVYEVTLVKVTAL